jgi:hypothetical protein
MHIWKGRGKIGLPVTLRNLEIHDRANPYVANNQTRTLERELLI